MGSEMCIRDSYEYGPLFAASVLAIVPPVAVAFFFQRYLVQGALSGAVKG